MNKHSGDLEKQNNDIELVGNTSSKNKYYDFMLKKEQLSMLKVTKPEDQIKYVGISELQKLELEVLHKLNTKYTDADPRLFQIYSYYGTRDKSAIAKKVAEKMYHKQIKKGINDELLKVDDMKTALQARNTLMGIPATNVATQTTVFGFSET